MSYSNTVLIKPSSYLCNMKCKYCFYIDENNRRVNKYGSFMSLDTFRNIIKKFLKETEKELYLVFQGGEPLLIGLDFYKEAVKLVNKLNINKINVYYSLQTNGTLINEEFCKFLKDNNFLVGVSIDGYQSIHDQNRIYDNSSGSYKDIIAGIDLLRQYDIPFNILTVISKEVANNPLKVYQNYKDNDFRYLQFIPLIDDMDAKENTVLNDELYLFLKKMFDYWYKDLIDGNRWSERYFDSLLNRIALNDHADCTMNNECGIMYAVEANGDVYPCDFYMIDEYLLGNINSDEISNLNKKRAEIRFLQKDINQKCFRCKYYLLCKGGCKRNYLNNINKYCDAYYRFFDYAYPKYQRIIELIKQGRI